VNTFPLATRAAVRRNLLRWFGKAARDLPWRRDRDPYRVWISEVMLQQTQVATVIPYFERFLRRFPDLPSLADADEQDVLHLWEGLGYYRRARDLHRAARMMRDEHAGRFPDDPATLRELPGFGRYTVNAVLSQAFERKLPILEANSVRVLCRLLGVRESPQESAVQKVLWQASEELLPVKQVGAFNQALMEIGALICTPTSPACPACPLAKQCEANRLGLQATIPPPKRQPVVESVEELALVLRRDERFLVVQRPASGRWANLWEFPHLEMNLLEPHAAAAERLLSQLGLQAKILSEVAVIRHAVTRFRITMTCLEAVVTGGEFVPGTYPRAEWLTAMQLSHRPFSVPQRKLAHRFLPM
jgi:A/G-specific adenine glycosylase